MFEYDDMMNNKNFLDRSGKGIFLLLVCLLFVLGACGPADDDGNENSSPNVTPYPGVSVEETPYPAPLFESGEVSEDAYPPPVATDKPLFDLDEPLKAGATIVTGQAPERLTLAIVDVTFGGVVLGTGESDDDGRFSITVTPLPDGHRIGVTITETEAGVTFEEIAQEYFQYRGDGFANIPNVGIFYDTALTEP